MGEYSPNQGFYIIDGDELVNVETDVNFNMERADAIVKPLIQHQMLPPDVSSITSSDYPKGLGYKWWKRWSNSIYTWSAPTPGGTPVARQDGNSTVEFWTSITAFSTGWSNYDSNPNPVQYHLSNGIVRLRGRAKYNAEIPANTPIDVLTLPTEIIPNTERFFLVSGGNSAASFQMFRVTITGASTSPKTLQIVKYGGNATTTNDRYLNLNAIMYPLAVS